MKVVIIGAGPAGITAAYELVKKHQGNEVVVLEESNRIGGISQTVRYNGNRMDIGGHRFFSKSKRVTDWWYEIMKPQSAASIDDKILKREKEYSETGADPEKEDNVMLKRHRVSRIYYKNKFFDYPVTMKTETIKNMGFATTIQAGFSYMGSVFHKLPEDSLENFYINRFGKKLYSMFFEGYTEKVWGRHPSRISADWGSQRVKGLSITAVIKDMLTKVTGSKKEVETSLIEEFYYPKFGPGQLWETALSQAVDAGAVLKMNCRAVKINTEGGKVTGVVYEENGIQHEEKADVVISAMPVKELVSALDAEVPENIAKAAQGLPYRDFITVGLLLKRLKLKNMTDIANFNGLVPDCWIYIQDSSVKLGRLQIFNNWSPYMVKDFQDKVWVGLEYFCNEGDDMWRSRDDDFINFAIGELEKIGIIDKDDVLDYNMERVKKAYPAYFDTYDQIDDIKAYLDGFNNLFCIGRNGQHRYNNMDHSMITAFEAVKEIMCSENGKYNKEKIWNVNAEKDYHEEK